MSLKAFLNTLKKEKPLKWVTGNQSADMDSVICSITYCYFNYKYDSSICFPLINIPRQDFRLRRDINVVLNQFGVTEDLLYFIEDFEKLNTEKVNVSLVDHCNLQGDTLINAYKKDMISVDSIIDHHADENVFLDAKPRIITPSGSCSSLVFNYWYAKVQNIESEIIDLLLAPLLIDTSNMTSKVETSDVEAFDKYRNLTGHPDINGFFKTIKTAKKDLAGFKVNEILRKDYKQFTFSDKVIGFSSIGKSADWIFKNYTNDEIIEGMDNVVNFFKLDLLIITPSYTDKSGNYRREFLMYHKQGFEDLVAKCTGLELNDDVYNIDSYKEKLEQVGLRIKNQGNLAASRKQIVPEVQKALL
ncbi:exopolyphosphatase [[Candida] jaroonii]|uniref:Exopolyphosphatase n=1 Tax=[Candida] jaroonii TaxID=467808 RepID=A0ACA9Y0E7_9ASCO|nr:exopolyphosphatase [[Candida] jaroonii]